MRNWGWEPLTPLRQGLLQTIDYFRVELAEALLVSHWSARGLWPPSAAEPRLRTREVSRGQRLVPTRGRRGHQPQRKWRFEGLCTGVALCLISAVRGR